MATVYPFEEGHPLHGAHPVGYHCRHQDGQFDQHLFRADYVLQSAELNEVQARAAEKARRMTAVLFDEGALVVGAGLMIDPDLAEDNAIGQAGQIYLDGEPRDVPEETFTVPLVGEVDVGIFLVNEIVTDADDATLRDPAVGLQNSAEPGAYRLKKTPIWGYADDPSPPSNATFHAVYRVIDGVVQPKGQPPDLTPINVAIARYDQQSTGGYYVSAGMEVIQLPDDAGEQVYAIKEGIARVGGQELVLASTARATYAPTADLYQVLAESHGANADPQTVTTNWSPISTVDQVTITVEITEEVVQRGATPNTADPLAHTSIVSVSEVKQGGTTYTSPADYLLAGDQIDWSPGGGEPAGGSNYNVTYRYTAVWPSDASLVDNITDTTLDVHKAVATTTIYVAYKWKMPRYDWLCIDPRGAVSFHPGLSHRTNPHIGRAPGGVLALAYIHQTWDENRRTVAAAVRMVPMGELSAIERRFNNLYTLVADLRLALNITAKDPAAKRGLFVDNLSGNDLRDAGLEQNGVVLNETLTLGIDETIYDQELAQDVTLDQTTRAVLIAQTMQTESLKVNPYLGFDPLPAKVMLTPALDFWSVTQDTWQAGIAQQFYTVDLIAYELGRAAWTNWWRGRNPGKPVPTWWDAGHTRITNDVVVRSAIETLSSDSEDVQFCRPQTVKFTASSLKPNAVIYLVTFGGQVVTPRETP
jgi:hypothetical protein